MFLMKGRIMTNDTMVHAVFIAMGLVVLYGFVIEYIRGALKGFCFV